jgi:hypothetical protein
MFSCACIVPQHPSYPSRHSRTAGVRIGRYLPQIVPLLDRFCAAPTAGADSKQQQQQSSSLSDEALNELRENCLQVCARVDSSPSLSPLSRTCMPFLKVSF